VLDDKTPGCADFRGNRQCISVGNVDANDRAALILMDYPNRWRLKIYAHAELRDLAEYAQVAGAFFRRGPCFGGARLAARGTAALDVEQFLLIGRQARPHLPQFVDRVDIGNNGVMTRALQPQPRSGAVGRREVASGVLYSRTLLSEDCVVLSSVDVNPYVVVLMKSRLQVK